MVDFRYHLVSLVSVFLALAVGIILGAGPLQNSIGTALSGQVSDLSAQNNELKNDNSRLTTQLAKEQSAFEQLTPGLVEDRLEGRTVAFVILPGADDAARESLVNTIEQSGATVSGEARVTESWTSSADATFRQSFADQILGYLAEEPDNSDANTVLSAALNQVVRLGTDDPDNSTLAGLITGSDTPMVQLSGLEEGADAVVVLAADTVDPEPQEGATPSVDADEQAQREFDRDAHTGLVEFFGDHGPTVAYGAADSADDVVRAVRDTVDNVSTVDSPASTISPVNVIVAIAAELEDGQIALGYDAGATAVTAEPQSSPAQGTTTDDETGAPGDGQTSDGDATATDEPTAEDGETTGEDNADADATTEG